MTSIEDVATWDEKLTRGETVDMPECLEDWERRGGHGLGWKAQRHETEVLATRA